MKGIRFTFVLTLLTSAASADQFHNINQLVGDRAIGLAGAYVAVSDDPAGMVYNPAGIAFASSFNISANMNTLQYSQIDYDDVLGGKYDYQRKSYQLLPSFFGVIQPLGSWMIGFSSSVTDSVQEKQDQSFEHFGEVEHYVFNLNNLATTYNVGFTAARRITDQFSIGFSLPLHYRTTEFISNQYGVFDSSAANTMEWQNIYVKTSEQGVRPKIGISWAPVPEVSLGLSINQTFVLKAKQTEQLARCTTDTFSTGCNSASVIPIIHTYPDRPNYPMAVRVGGAWFPSNALLISADAIYHSAVEQSSEAFTDLEATLDGAMGIEWYWSPKWALRGGAYTSFANTPTLNLADLAQSPHVDRYGGTLSIARFNKGSSISLGIVGLYGIGKSQLFADINGLLQDTRSLNLTAFVTTSYRY
jgi:long-subunit fatty acid transport protein